ncbi:putative semaphorin-3ab-like isoform 2 [Scophthalmus maximus]|nr:putative semaphorin-3ab-like [Scophthalmus maximus]AWP09368.1 putative semaphorin-3ab-like isoform 2 [Scophthalmus maximus]
MCWPQTAVLLAHLGFTLTGAWRASQPRLQFTHSELVQNGRLLMLPLVAGDLHSLLPDENGRRLYVAMKDNLLSTSLDDITQNPRKLYWPASPDRVQECLLAGKDPELECANFLRVLQPFNQTHLYVCGTGAFNPRCALVATSIFQRSEHQTLSYSQTECGKGKCPYDPFQKTASAVVDGELYAGITSDFMSRDSAFFRSLGSRRVLRTEQYDSTWLQNAQFVRVAPLSETDNPEDDKVYVFFTERAQEAEGAAGKVLYSRVARVCKNDIGGQRSLVNKWSTFQKARMVCSVPGPDGLQTHFDQLQDIFILQGKDKKNPLIYGLFTTSSDILNGSAVCVYRMEDVVRAFKGNFLHKEGPQYKWAEFTGQVPYPRPGTCPSSTYGSYSSTREYPDDVIFFSRTHPLLQENVLPLGERPLLVRVGVHYKFSKLLVDRVEAVDGTYDVLFIGTDSGLVLKAIHLPREHGQSQEVTLEQLQVFQHKSPVTAMTLSKKKQWLFVGSREGVSQLALYQCELYGQACAECCLARDPYCTWDGHACSPYMPTVRRRNARHLGEDEDPLTQCVRQGGGGMSLSPAIGTEVPEMANGVVIPVVSENGPHVSLSVKCGGSRATCPGEASEDGSPGHTENHVYDGEGRLDTAMAINERISSLSLHTPWVTEPSLSTDTCTGDSESGSISRDIPGAANAVEPPDDAPCPPHVMAQVWVRNVRGMQDSKSLDEISQTCGGSVCARGGGRGGQSEGRRATISSALELEGTVSQEGDLTHFITKNLEQKIKMSSKPSLDCSDSDCSGPIYRSRGSSRRPADIPPIDTAVLLDLQRHTQEVAHSVEMMMRSLNGTIQNMTALSVGYIQTYRDSVDSLGESVDMSIKGMYTLMARCEELDRSMQPIHTLASQIRDIKRTLDALEAICK